MAILKSNVTPIKFQFFLDPILSLGIWSQIGGQIILRGCPTKCHKCIIIIHYKERNNFHIGSTYEKKYYIRSSQITY